MNTTTHAVTDAGMITAIDLLPSEDLNSSHISDKKRHINQVIQRRNVTTCVYNYYRTSMLSFVKALQT